MDSHKPALDTEKPNNLELGPVDGQEDLHDKWLDREALRLDREALQRVREERLTYVGKRRKSASTTTSRCTDDETETGTETVPES